MRGKRNKKPARVDPTRLEIFKNVFHSVAEEMGAALRRSAFSPNIKERRDYSCAVYDARWPGSGDGRSHAGASGLHAGFGRCRARRVRTGARRHRAAERPLRRRHALAGHNDGRADFSSRPPPAVVLRRQPRAPRRRRRRTGRIDGPSARNFSGRPAHPAGKTIPRAALWIAT